MNPSRKNLASLTLALAAACAVSAPAFAQPGPDAPKNGRGFQAHQMHKHGAHHGHRMGARGGVENMRSLNLTEAQRDKIFEIRHAAAPETRQIAKEIAEARKALRKLGKADKFDEAKAKAAADSQGAAVAKAALLNAKTQSQIHAVLTPEQRQQLEQRRDRQAPPQSKPAS